MKRILAMLLCCVLILSGLACSASAASDVTIYEDTTLTQKFNVYENLTLAPGVTLTTKMSGNEPQGIEMHGALTLGEGAKIVGSGCILMFEGSSYSGIPFYYSFGGEFRPFPDMATAYERFSAADDYVFEFRYNESIPGWVWTETFSSGDPFAEDPAVPMQDAEAFAETLHALGLMKGTGTRPDGSTEFSLEDDLTRVQAVVMMIRLLGKEKEALNGSWSHPFTDVPEWADAYVGYAYTNRITNGVSATEFGNGKASAAMYLTFILRAMGYNDDAEKGKLDFFWSNAPFFARELGINLTDEEIDGFRRAEAAVASLWALRAVCKDGRPLSDQLIEQNVFPRDQYEDVMRPYETKP